jgi:hypothetical protein
MHVQDAPETSHCFLNEITFYGKMEKFINKDTVPCLNYTPISTVHDDCQHGRATVVSDQQPTSVKVRNSVILNQLNVILSIPLHMGHVMRGNMNVNVRIGLKWTWTESNTLLQ